MVSLINEPGERQSEVWGAKTGPSDSYLLAEWYKLGPEFTYNVWYASNPDGPWIKHNETRLYDSILSEGYETTANNTYEVDGLDSDTVYYIKVTCVDRYNSWWIGYSDTESVNGGLGHEEDTPLPPFGNYVGFKIEVL